MRPEEQFRSGRTCNVRRNEANSAMYHVIGSFCLVFRCGLVSVRNFLLISYSRESSWFGMRGSTCLLSFEVTG